MRALTCKERDNILHSAGRYVGWEVAASLTDAFGEFGEPRIETTWARGNERVRDVRHPHVGSYSRPDRKPCEHYAWEEQDDD